MSSESKPVKQRKSRRSPPPPTHAPPVDLKPEHVLRHSQEQANQPRPTNNREDMQMNPEQSGSQYPTEPKRFENPHNYPYDKSHVYSREAYRTPVDPYFRHPTGPHSGYPYHQPYPREAYHGYGPPQDVRGGYPVAWGVDPGYHLQQRVQQAQQRHSAQAPPPYEYYGAMRGPEGYERPFQGQPQRRAPPPQQFQPYVDDDFRDPHPFRRGDSARGEVLGENRPSTFDVSVATLQNSTYRSEDSESMSISSIQTPSNNSVSSSDKTVDNMSSDNKVESARIAYVSSKKENLSIQEMNKEPRSMMEKEKSESTPSKTKVQGLQDRVPQKVPKKKATKDGVRVIKSTKNKVVSAPNPSFSGYSRCLIMRDRKGVKNRLNPTYNLYSQDVAPGSPPRLIMIAQKQTGRTPNYRFFDMTKGGTTDRLDKHSRNFIGKLRGNFNRDEYTCYGRDKEIKGAVVFDKGDMLSQFREGALPRKMGVLLPLELLKPGTELNPVVDEDGADSHEETKTEGGEMKLSPEDRLAAMIDQVNNNRSVDQEDLSKQEQESNRVLMADVLKGRVGGKGSAKKEYLQLTSKEPVFEKQNYRLNFHGRVKLPSVKNYQLIQPSDIDNVWTQFGKVTEDQFHLDYKEPLDTFTAFALAITQFDY